MSDVQANLKAGHPPAGKCITFTIKYIFFLIIIYILISQLNNLELKCLGRENFEIYYFK